MTMHLLRPASHLLLLLLRVPFVGHEALRGLPRLAQRLQVNASIRGRSTQAALQALRARTCTIEKEILEPSLVCKTHIIVKPVLQSYQTLHESNN